MATLDDLPVELLLRILAYLPLRSLGNLRVTCRRWQDFFIANKSAIYHRIAVEKGFVKSFDTPFARAAAKAPYINFLQDETPDWYTFCESYRRRGRCPSQSTEQCCSFTRSRQNIIHIEAGL
ncbi:hypothetical protein PYCCODRAFT_751498 [Trametes coccinea BRFM310]|uniref:F-box domain-containing protein n=1 Tax=Trametes coccinea (strain BRFM310) TaxID=1353009 RepID=A0A1Y2IFF9_TRAC3|nr:hypothetical protein PYCCODRAFT_751498 [Trametes coccinea BRFM310]